MLSRNKVDFYFFPIFCVENLIPPIHIDSVLDSAFHHIITIPESGINTRIVSSIIEGSKGFDIHVIIVIVREEDNVDGRKIRKLYTRFYEPLGSNETEWARTMRVDRISDDIYSLDLDEERCMADIGDNEILSIMIFFDLYRSDFFFLPVVNSPCKNKTKKPIDIVRCFVVIFELLDILPSPSHVHEAFSVEVIGHGPAPFSSLDNEIDAYHDDHEDCEGYEDDRWCFPTVFHRERWRCYYIEKCWKRKILREL